MLTATTVVAMLNLPKNQDRKLRVRKSERVSDTTTFVSMVVEKQDRRFRYFLFFRSKEEAMYLADNVPGLEGLAYGLTSFGTVTFVKTESKFDYKGINTIDVFLNGVCDDDILAWVASKLTGDSVAYDSCMPWGNVLKMSEVGRSFHELIVGNGVRIYRAPERAKERRMFLSWVVVTRLLERFRSDRLSGVAAFFREAANPLTGDALLLDEPPRGFEALQVRGEPGAVPRDGGAEHVV